MNSRKLATILSLDVAGYSAAAERDDAAAAEGVRSLRATIKEIVAPFGGRIFSSAGDGFMLEFPVASAGVQAAMALLDACKSPTQPLPQIRIGVHLGEVIVEEGGDLLGHGVNIAARLQQRTQPGAMIVSQDVRNSVRGELADRLKPLGTIQLDKMSQRIAIYGYGNGAILRGPRWDTRTLLISAGVAVLAVVAAIGFFALKPAPVGARTAVFTLTTPSGDQAAQTLADGVANEIIDTMSEIGLEPVSRAETNAEAAGTRLERAQALHAVYALDGDITPEGAVVRVSMRLDEVSSHQTLWAQTFEGSPAHMSTLRLQVATAAVGVLRCAAEMRKETPRLTSTSAALLLRICETTSDSGSAERLRLARQLVQAAPHSSLAQGRLAVEAGNAIEGAPENLQAQLGQEAGAAADAALRLNPHNGTAGAVKVFLLGAHQDRAGAERTAREYLDRFPDSPQLNSLYGNLLRSVGRNAEAAAYFERASALDPISPFRTGLLGWTLAISGQSDKAIPLLEQAVQRWPEEGDVNWARFRTSFWFAPVSDTRRVLAEDRFFTVSDKACWRVALDGLSAGGAARRAAATRVRVCMGDQPYNALQVLASLDDVDGAFEMGERAMASGGARPNVSMFFVPAARALRRDPRFMPMMQRSGLTAYWLQSDHWPDFCSEPDLPYDCRTEAARLEGRR